MVLQTVGLWVPLAADGVTQVQHPAELNRAFLRAASPRPGVTRPGGTANNATNLGGFAATIVPAAMQLTVAAGACFIPGQENTLQSAGNYFAYSEASEVITWPAASGSNRMDSLLLQISDPQYGSIGGNPLGPFWRAVAGSSASARPDSDFKSGGSQYVPGAWIRMYDILVPASATQLTQTNVAFKAGYSSTVGFTPMFLGARPTTGLFYGELAFEMDTGRWYEWNGTAWTWPYPRGLVGGNRYTAGGNRSVNPAAETTAGITTPTLVLEANRSFEIRWNAYISVASSTFVTLRVRETNVTGTVRARWDGVQTTSGNYSQILLGHYETGSVDETKTFVATTATTGVNITSIAGDSTNHVALEVFDVGRSAIDGVI